MNIELTAEEIEMITTLIDERIGDLGPELHHTRTPAYHEELKQIREKLKALRRKLPAGAPR